MAEFPAGTTTAAKHPALAMALASVRIFWFALRHGAKPMIVDYSTGKVRLGPE